MGGKGGMVIGGTIAAFLPIVFVMILLVALGNAQQQAAAACASGAGGAAAPGAAPVSANQTAYVQTIIGVAKTLGIPQQGWVVALATALDESGIRNLANPAVPASLGLANDGLGADHDSVGIFQQRPASGWGTPAQIMNPAYSAEAFFGAQPAGGTTNRGLLEVPGWLGLPVTVAAQDVQGSATPTAYAKFQTEATQL
ncbi:MAG: M23 family peptidase, partial [Actinomycetota bacterium]|nr:M23 family peptidase [Actinomycetota bacterium]